MNADIKQVLDIVARNRESVVELRLADLLKSRHQRALDTLSDAGELVSDSLTGALALSAVKAAGWLFDPDYGPQLLEFNSGETRRLIAVTPPGMLGSGVVTSLTLTAGGSGYTSEPTVVFTGGGPAGAGASARAVLAAGAISAIAVTNGGSGYRTIPGITLTGAAGTGGSFTVLLTPSSVTRIDVTGGGSGYTQSSTTATLTGGGGSGARIRRVEVTSGRVSHIVLDAVGSGYTSPPAVTITDSAGSNPGTGATAVALLRATSIASVTVTDGGSGYTSPPTISFTGGQGSGATATATLEARAVASLSVLTGGGGYATAPTVTITGGGGTGATATATITVQQTAGEGSSQRETPPTFGSKDLVFHTLRPIVHVSKELLQDAESSASIIGSALGAEVAATIERHLVLDADDGLLGVASHPQATAEAHCGTINTFAPNQPLGNASQTQLWHGLHDCLEALPDVVRADPRCCWYMSPRWHDGIIESTTDDTNRPNIYEWDDGPYNVPVKLLGAGARVPASNADDRIRFAFAGVMKYCGALAFAGQASLIVDAYSLGHEGLVRITLVQRYAASRWNSSYYSTLAGPVYTN